MIYGRDILKSLVTRFDAEDAQYSSHWQFYYRFLEIDESISICNSQRFWA